MIRPKRVCTRVEHVNLELSLQPLVALKSVGTMHEPAIRDGTCPGGAFKQRGRSIEG